MVRLALKVLPPVDWFDTEPSVLVNMTVLLYVVLCVRILGELVITIELIVGPPLPFPKFTVVPLQNKVPVVAATVPDTALEAPFTENENELIFNTPLLIVKLFTVVLPVIIQLLAPVTMVTLSVVPGMPLGVQLVLVPQLVEVVPFQT
jgi:hypothetical protein